MLLTFCLFSDVLQETSTLSDFGVLLVGPGALVMLHALPIQHRWPAIRVFSRIASLHAFADTGGAATCCTCMARTMCTSVIRTRHNAMQLCNNCHILQVIATCDSIRCLNGSDVKAETRMYLQQLAKRGLRPVRMPEGSKCMDFGVASATGCRVSEHGASVTGSWAIACQSSPSSGSRASSKASRRTNGLGTGDKGKHAQPVSMECVGAALVGRSGITEVGGDGTNQETRDLAWQGMKAACIVQESMQLSLNNPRPGMLKQTSGTRGDVNTSKTVKQAIFRP